MLLAPHYDASLLLEPLADSADFRECRLHKVGCFFVLQPCLACVLACYPSRSATCVKPASRKLKTPLYAFVWPNSMMAWNELALHRGAGGWENCTKHGAPARVCKHVKQTHTHTSASLVFPISHRLDFLY